MMTGLCLHDVTYGYDRRTPIFDELDLTFCQGKTVLLGPNGAGKSTLAKIVSGTESPRCGEVKLPNSERGSRRELQRCVGYMPQDIRPVPGLRVAEQVAYAAWLAGVPRKQTQHRAMDALEIVDLADRARSHAGRLSGGQLRRVGLAQVLAADPQFLILDEPTAGLDPAQRAGFRRVLDAIDLPWGVLVITHQVDDIAHTYDDVVVLDHGSVRFQGTPAQFLALSTEGADSAYLQLVGEE